jgi:hypothetical protein
VKLTEVIIAPRGINKKLETTVVFQGVCIVQSFSDLCYRLCGHWNKVRTGSTF